MNNDDSALTALIESLKRLPGVGFKTAQRMALHLLLWDREGMADLSVSLNRAAEKMRNCTRCRTLTEEEVCRICTDPARDQQRICVVESVLDQQALESAGAFNGLYFILHGTISPIDGRTAKDLHLHTFRDRAVKEKWNEVIIATNRTMEGEATGIFISEFLAELGIATTRIASGVPSGGELQYLDQRTLAQAMGARRGLSLGRGD